MCLLRRPSSIQTYFWLRMLASTLSSILNRNMFRDRAKMMNWKSQMGPGHSKMDSGQGHIQEKTAHMLIFTEAGQKANICISIPYVYAHIEYS